MKRKFTEARKANRYYPKSAPGGIYCMSVEERRKAGILAPDSQAYDLKHGKGKRTAKKTGLFNLGAFLRGRKNARNSKGNGVTKETKRASA